MKFFYNFFSLYINDSRRFTKIFLIFFKKTIDNVLCLCDNGLTTKEEHQKEGGEKVKRLKRKYLVILSVIVTVLTGLFIQLCIIRLNDIKKDVQECDTAMNHPCTYYEIRQYQINR